MVVDEWELYAVGKSMVGEGSFSEKREGEGGPTRVISPSPVDDEEKATMQHLIVTKYPYPSLDVLNHKMCVSSYQFREATERECLTYAYWPGITR